MSETEAERLKAEIEATRAELAETADALAAKLDVKAQANKKVHEVGDRVSEKVGEKYAHVHDAAPAPVQKALDKTGEAISPVMARAAADKRRTLLILAGTAVLIVVVRRVRNRKR